MYWLGPLVGGLLAGLLYDLVFAANASAPRPRLCSLNVTTTTHILVINHRQCNHRRQLKTTTAHCHEMQLLRFYGVSSVIVTGLALTVISIVDVDRGLKHTALLDVCGQQRLTWTAQICQEILIIASS